MNNTIETSLSEITSKVKKLKARTSRLETENEELRKSIFEYLQQLESYKKESEKRIQGERNLEVMHSLKTDKKVLQKELDKYILMLDKCIAAVKASL